MRIDRTALGTAVVVSLIWIALIGFRHELARVYYSGVLGLERAAGSLTRVRASQQPGGGALTQVGQPFSRVLRSMYDHEPQTGTDGQTHNLTPTTGVTVADGLYLYNLCKRVKPAQTMEVGFAEGFSTLYFLAAMDAQSTKSPHIAIDPFEMTDWHGIGMERVREVGMQDHFRFVEAKSVAALSQLASQGQRFQIIFIDGDHRFDGQFADFALADSLCPEGGYLLFHDIFMPATSKLAAFIRRNRPDYVSLKTGVNIAAFQKRGEDHRPFDHFVGF